MTVGRAYRHAGGNMSEDNDALAAANMAGRYDGRKQAETEVARLTKERKLAGESTCRRWLPISGVMVRFRKRQARLVHLHRHGR